MNYNQMVSSYTGMWEKPMSFYTIIINSFVFFLTPLAILLIGNTGHYTPVLLDFFLFVLITPVFSQSIMKSMYLSQALGQAQEALGRLNRLVNYEQLSTSHENVSSMSKFDITFSHVSFTYPRIVKKKPIDDISFTIPPRAEDRSCRSFR